MLVFLIFTSFPEDDDGSSTGLEDEDDTSTGAEEIKMQMLDKPSTEKVSSRKETEAGAEISALVNYVQPIHFVSFEVAESWLSLSTISSNLLCAIFSFANCNNVYSCVCR